MQKLNTSYPLVYYYVSKKNEYLECIDWKKSNYLKVSSSDDYTYVKSKNEVECRKISNYRFINNLKNKNFYYNNTNEDVKIYPTFLGIEKYKREINVYYLNLTKEKNDIILDNNEIYFLIQNEVSKIEKINITSRNYSNSAVVILGTNLEINEISYRELVPKKKIFQYKI